MINTLPTELQHYILLDVTRVDWPWPESDMGLGERLSMAPFRLSAICRHWRDIVLNTPSIWQLVYFSGLLKHWRFDRAEVVMKRAKDNQLQLVIDAGAGAKAKRPDLLKKLRSLFEVHGHRWIRIHVILPSRLGQLFVSSFFDSISTLSNVEELVVLPTTGQRGNIFKMNRPFVAAPPHLPLMPLLRRWESHALIMVPRQDTSPLSTLRFLSYSVRGIPEALLWQTLRSCPALVELNIYFPALPEVAVRPSDWTQLILMSKVTRLRIFGFWRNSNWLEWVDFPKVKTLAVSVESCDFMRPLFIKLGTQIRHLIVTSIDGSTFSIIGDTDAEALKDLECLETLELRDLPPTTLRSGSQSFFRHLLDGTFLDASAPSIRPVCVSSFTRLILRNCEIHLNTSGELAKLVQNRRDDAEKGLGPELLVETPGTKFVADEETNDSEVTRVREILSSSSVLSKHETDSAS